ncbi:hypothetical protein BAPNAU_1796 [Bacillus velezensis NAU-B3]|nr:hypothetical protein BAPNAU_1796 [Bacillus velezensis NAU-B3]
MTRLKRIEVVPSLKAEMSLVVHDKQAVANMQPEWEFHTPTNLEHHGGVSTCLRAGYFPLRHREKKQKLIKNRSFLSQHCYCSFDRERNVIGRFCYGK